MDIGWRLFQQTNKMCLKKEHNNLAFHVGRSGKKLISFGGTREKNTDD